MSLRKANKGNRQSSPVPRKASAKQATDPYWTGAHTTHRLRFPLVWIPKYRRRVLQGLVAARLTELLRQGCEVPAGM